MCSSISKRFKVNVLNYRVQPKNGLPSSPSMITSPLLFNPLLTEADDSAFFIPSSYKDIFGKTKRTSCYSRKILSVVKIEGNGRSIHRRFRTSILAEVPDAETVVLSALSCMLLFDNVPPEDEMAVTVSKGSWLSYYWNHPFHATRISFRVGLPALIISVVSLILAVLPYCCCLCDA